MITTSGGTGIMATDFIEASRLRIADLSDETVKMLEKFFPEWMPVANPIDIWSAVEKNQKTGIDVYPETSRPSWQTQELMGSFYSFCGAMPGYP